MEKIGYLKDAADNPELSDELRQQVRDGLARIEAGDPVHPVYQDVRVMLDAADIDRDARLHLLAEEALARVKDAPIKPKPAPAVKGPGRYAVRAFVLTWAELHDWWERYDLESLARQLSDEQAEAFYATAEGTAQAARRLRALRATSSLAYAPSDPRPIRGGAHGCTCRS
ncbi:MAG: hypothetical protein LKI30_01560 [Bifidobacterium crudilactis]|nr:hypothetical protein [Bifidobacterium crudilactis]